MSPLVSVIVPVYNSEKFLQTCINSILCQTYNNFELLLIDDGSTDNSLKIMKSFNDQRIKIIINKNNNGLVKTRNIGIKSASGKYIAWLDSDDYNHKKRLEYQVRLLENHHDIGICGSWIKVFGKFSNILKYETCSDIISCKFLFEDPVATSSTMIRRNILTDNKLKFNINFPLAEDYDLWQRMSKYCKVKIIPKILTYYRVHNNQCSTSLYNSTKHKKIIMDIQKRQMTNLDIVPNQEELELHYKIGTYKYEKNLTFLQNSKKWFNLLAIQNKQILYYDHNALLKFLSFRWHNICLKNNKLGLEVYKIYKKFFISNFMKNKTIINFILFTKCLLGSFLLFVNKRVSSK